MPNKDISSTLLAGLLSSGLFLLVFGIGLGFFFMFLPTLPLFALGFSRHPRHALHAALFASAIIAVTIGLPAAILFLLFLGIPAWYIVRESLKAHDNTWFPIGRIFVPLTLCACTLVALATAWYAGEPGGLPHVLSQNIHAAFADLQGEYGDVIDALAGDWSFLIFAITIWMWGVALYAHAWLAQRVLVRKKRALRPDFALTPFAMPNWMLGLLAICALATLIGSPSMSFLGKSTLISLLLPYFFLGVSLIQGASAAWPSRRFLIFFLYFITFAQFWPALIIAGIGLWHHIKHLSTPYSSFKS